MREREREKDTLMLIKWRGVEKFIYRVSQTLTLECIFFLYIYNDPNGTQVRVSRMSPGKR